MNPEALCPTVVARNKFNEAIASKDREIIS